MKKVFASILSYRNSLLSLPAGLKVAVVTFSLPFAWIGWSGLGLGLFSGFTKAGAFVSLGGAWGWVLNVTLIVAGLLPAVLLLTGLIKEK